MESVGGVMSKKFITSGTVSSRDGTSLIKIILKEVTSNKYLYIMALPVALYYLLFHYGPMYGAVIAFKDYNIAKGVLESPWVGFKHFQTFFESRYFGRLMRNTFFISLEQLIWGFPAPVLLALLLNEVRNKYFKRTVQTLSYLPHFISLVVIAGMIHDFMGRDGLITDLFTLLGGKRTNLLSVAGYFRTIYVSTGIWQQIGWGSIIYLAALSGIDSMQYEAAEIDGAGRLRKLLHITIPGMLPTVIILLILNIGNMLNIGFQKVILLYNPLTYETADIISSFVYRTGLGGSFQYSYTTAIGMFQSTLNLILLLSANRLSRKVSETSLW